MIDWLVFKIYMDFVDSWILCLYQLGIVTGFCTDKEFDEVQLLHFFLVGSSLLFIYSSRWPWLLSAATEALVKKLTKENSCMAVDIYLCAWKYYFLVWPIGFILGLSFCASYAHTDWDHFIGSKPIKLSPFLHILVMCVLSSGISQFRVLLSWYHFVHNYVHREVN